MESFQELDIHQAQELIKKENPTIADVRDLNAFEESHIENAVSVNDSNIEEFMGAADKSKPLICYCYHGMSSQGAAQHFKENGFQKVFSISGGFEEWRGTYPTSNSN